MGQPQPQSSSGMSVTNKTIRDLEDAAVEATKVMSGAADLLEAAGMARLVRLLRQRADELARAESACACERITTMNEAALREEKLADGLGLAPDTSEPIVESVVRLDDSDITRLLADEISREFKIDRAALDSLPYTTLLRLRVDLKKAALLVLKAVRISSPAVVAAEIRSQYEQAFGVKPAFDAGLIIADQQLLDHPIDHHSSGLGDGGKSPMQAWNGHVDALKVELSDSVRELWRLSEGEPVPNTMLVPDTPAGREAAARIRQLNEEYGYQPDHDSGIERHRQIAEARALGECSPAILRALAILAEEAQS
jgi:hypothetical protein